MSKANLEVPYTGGWFGPSVNDILLYVLVIMCVIVAISADSQGETFDKKYWSVASVELAAIGLDAYTTAGITPRRDACSFEEGSPMMYGRHPEAPRVAMVMSAEAAISMGVSYFAKKHHSRFWAVPMLYLATTHAYGAAANFRNCF